MASKTCDIVSVIGSGRLMKVSLRNRYQKELSRSSLLNLQSIWSKKLQHVWNNWATCILISSHITFGWLFNWMRYLTLHDILPTAYIGQVCVSHGVRWGSEIHHGQEWTRVWVQGGRGSANMSQTTHLHWLLHPALSPWRSVYWVGVCERGPSSWPWLTRQTPPAGTQPPGLRGQARLRATSSGSSSSAVESDLPPPWAGSSSSTLLWTVEMTVRTSIRSQWIRVWMAGWASACVEAQSTASASLSAR